MNYCKHHIHSLHDPGVHAHISEVEAAARRLEAKGEHALMTTMRLLNEVVRRYDQLHATYHEEIEVAQLHVKQLMEMLQALPGGAQMLDNWRRSMFALMCYSAGVPPWLIVQPTTA